jgi:Fe-S-cluster containining protein
MAEGFMENPHPQKFVQIERREKLSREDFSQVISSLEMRVRDKLSREVVPLRKLSGRRYESFFSTADAPLPDCRTCGACCAALLIVELTENDTTPPENYWNVTIEGKDGELVVNRYLRRETETGKCPALGGEVGESVECAIYENRPGGCRTFEAGSDKCRALRRAYGIEPPLDDMETMSFMMKVFHKDEPAGDERLIYHTQISETETAGLFEIEVFLNDETSVIIHQFKANEESWLESDFLSLTLTEAGNLVAERTKKVY